MLRRLWRDDAGAVVSAEFVLVVGLVVFGTAGYLAGVRDEVNAGLGNVAAGIRGVVPDPAAVRKATAFPVPPPPPPPAFSPILLDFGNAPVQSGYTGFPWAAYSATPGYGFTSASPDFPNLDRAAAVSRTSVDFFRDLNASSTANGPQSFKFGGLTPGTSYDVRAYLYDHASACNGTYYFRDKNATGNAVAPVVPFATGNPATTGTLTITADGSGVIEFERFNSTGSFAAINGLELALTGELPAALD